MFEFNNLNFDQVLIITCVRAILSILSFNAIVNDR